MKIILTYYLLLDDEVILSEVPSIPYGVLSLSGLSLKSSHMMGQDGVQQLINRALLGWLGQCLVFHLTVTDVWWLDFLVTVDNTRLLSVK